MNLTWRNSLTILLKGAALGSRRVYNMNLRDDAYVRVKKYIINIPAAAVRGPAVWWWKLGSCLTSPSVF